MEANSQVNSSLPLILAGPVLRKCSASTITVWLVSSQPLRGCFSLYYPDQKQAFYTQDLTSSDQIQAGDNAWVLLACFNGDFPTDTPLQYNLHTQDGDLAALLPSLLYPGEIRPTFVIKTRADYILHGSCRNPHHHSGDSLVSADNKVAGQTAEERPALLMMSGDQIYADHVAGPVLDAIGQVIELLGLPDESFADAPVADSAALYQHDNHFYARDKLLPHYVEGDNWLSDTQRRLQLFNRPRPVFSSRESENHLITFAEFFAMYLLVWSPQLWSLVDHRRLQKQAFCCGNRVVEPKWQAVWQEELEYIEGFIGGLDQVQRLMAHIPCYMVFDDHDITDDWNLTVGWEQAAYSNLFSRRIIGNGLISYWLCQGWGNDPRAFDKDFWRSARACFEDFSSETQDSFIQLLYAFQGWHYRIETSPLMLVLDTRTRRWRSESKMNKPSGLMDWEALTEMQQSLLNEPAVIIVSAAPMFGVKFIEALQRVLTWLGQPLLIDAENWMAHPGAANALLSIFTHSKTPRNFIILSGDVHYSFAYDIKLRFRRSSPDIYQITSSGIKNEFPNALLRFCEWMDRVLYSTYSPLNWFTKRKRMKIRKRDPDCRGGARLINRSGIGELWLDAEGKPKRIALLTAKGEEVAFNRHEY